MEPCWKLLSGHAKSPLIPQRCVTRTAAAAEPRTEISTRDRRIADLGLWRRLQVRVVVPQHREADRFLKIFGVLHRGLVAQSQAILRECEPLDGVLARARRYVDENAGGVGLERDGVDHERLALPLARGVTEARGFDVGTMRRIQTHRAHGVEDHRVAAAVSSDLREDLARRVDAIEAGYELMLAYAAQGLPSDTLAANGGQLREYLRRFDDALTGLADRYREYVTTQQGVAPEAFEGFLEVLAGDARSAQAGLRLVMAQGSISSQLVDNLNASIHVRALLTDIFLIDEALK